MKAVNQMTVKEIIESIEVMRNGLSLNPGEREKQILLKNIARAQDELKKREEQKKKRSATNRKTRTVTRLGATTGTGKQSRVLRGKKASRAITLRVTTTRKATRPT